MRNQISSYPRAVLGVFGVSTLHRKSIRLKNGGACLFLDGELVVAISEERLNRVKHSTGFWRSVEYCLNYAGIRLSDIEVLAVSNCCDTPGGPFPELDNRLPKEVHLHKVDSHHRSHALLAAMQSGYDSALVVVADNEGNLLGPPRDRINYWNNAAERVSFYKYSDGDLQLIARDCVSPSNIGLGDTYHYFTHFLGWTSYTQAGRVMGLSACGNADRFGHIPIWSINQEKGIQAHLKNNRPEKLESIRSLALNYGVDLGPGRLPGDSISSVDMDIAAWVQKQLERTLVDRVKSILRFSGQKSICLAGGIAYNCLANRAILMMPEVERIFVSYAPGDEGQPMGNALDVLWPFRDCANINVGRSPFLGRSYQSDRIEKAISQLYLDPKYKVVDSNDVLLETADLLARGAIVGWFQGRSEMGSRALGNRCILADPRYIEIKNKINQKKGREWFRPVAPSVTKEASSRFFDIAAEVPYMSIASKTLQHQEDAIPAVTHEDGTSRLQTVDIESNRLFHALLKRFEQLTGIPLLCNTSFNANGEPIVETPDDAVTAFKELCLDALVIGDYIVLGPTWLGRTPSMQKAAALVPA